VLAGAQRQARRLRAACPDPNVSVVDLKFIAKRATTKDEINAIIKAAADGPLKGVLGYTTEKNVSIDFNHDPHSSIFHMDQTRSWTARWFRSCPGTTTNGLLEPHGRHGRGDGKLI